MGGGGPRSPRPHERLAPEGGEAHTVRVARSTGPDPPRNGTAERKRGLWGRLRGGRAEAPTPWPAQDPVEVLRSIIAPSDGVDRSTVELLAEEQGFDLVTVTRTLERLRRDGSLRYERGPDGEEVLAWAHLDGV